MAGRQPAAASRVASSGAIARQIGLLALGVGECAALALFGLVSFVGTADLVVAAIRAKRIDVAASDEVKRRWLRDLRFKLEFESYGHLL